PRHGRGHADAPQVVRRPVRVARSRQPRRAARADRAPDGREPPAVRAHHREGGALLMRKVAEKSDLLTREEAIEVAFGRLPADALVVCANGYIGREAQRVRDRLGNFYMIGSMGLAPSIALGVALARSDRRVVVLDGDGNVLMGMGTLASVASQRPK